MNRSILAIFMAIILLPVNVSAKEEPDELDTTKIEQKLKDLGIPTVSSVDNAESKALALFEKNDCKSAVPALKKFAQTANHLANLLSAQNDPFYGADRDERKYFGVMDDEKALAQELRKLEKTSNKYKMKRNHAYVMMGECLNKIGKHKESIAILVGALDLIEFKDKEWWERARMALSKQLGFE